MKKAILFCFFITTISWAQYPSGMYGNSSRGYGMGSNAMTQMNSMPSSGSKKGMSDKEKSERINAIMDKLKTDLKLDELQEYIIKKEYETNSLAIDKLLERDGSAEDKRKEVEAITEKTDRNILTYLNKDQKEKYKAYIETRKTGAQ